MAALPELVAFIYFEAWLKPPVYMCFLRILNKIQVLGMLMTNQMLFIKRF